MTLLKFIAIKLKIYEAKPCAFLQPFFLFISSQDQEHIVFLQPELRPEFGMSYVILFDSSIGLIKNLLLTQGAGFRNSLAFLKCISCAACDPSLLFMIILRPLPSPS